jgi:hypothetical protein
MGAFLAALGKGAKAYGKRRLQRKGFLPSAPSGAPSSGSAGADPVADAVSAGMRGKKRSNKQRGD